MASCKDCKFAKFEFTATGRISRTSGGRCTFGPTFVVSAVMKVNITKSSIWPDDGKDCKVFEHSAATAA